MGTPDDDAGPAARSAADAELAHQDQVAAEGLSLSMSNLTTMATTLAEEGYGDAAGVLTRAAAQESGEAARHALQGEYFQEASNEWGVAAIALDHQAKASGQALVAAADRRHALEGLDQPSITDIEHALAASAEAAIEARMRTHIDEAAISGRVAEDSAERAIVAEEQAHGVHPEVTDSAAQGAADPE